VLSSSVFMECTFISANGLLKNIMGAAFRTPAARGLPGADFAVCRLLG